MTEWLCSGLQLRVRRFDSDSRLHSLPIKSFHREGPARVVELVDTADLKSAASNSVPVQVRSRAPILFFQKLSNTFKTLNYNGFSGFNRF